MSVTSFNKCSIQMKDANFPLSEDGRTYHLETKLGEVAQRVITVGDPRRARKIANQFMKNIRVDKMSHRNFLTLTGTYNGQEVSIVAIGMGVAAMDFFMRECRAVVEGDMAIIRLGTCGILDESVPIGSVIVQDGSIMIQRNPKHFHENQKEPAYLLGPLVSADQRLCNSLHKEVIAEVEERWVQKGLNGTGCSFYSSQGRQVDHFNDNNGGLIDSVIEKYPQIKTLEMETFHLFDLANTCQKGKIFATSALIGLAQRKKGGFLANDIKYKRELQLGKAALEALASFNLQRSKL